MHTDGFDAGPSRMIASWRRFKTRELKQQEGATKKNNLGWLGYINGESPTQIYWDYFKKYCKGPYQHNH